MPDWTDVLITLPTALNVAFMFAFGACAGSFIHVVAYRMPEGLSVVRPPSRCPSCGLRLPWHANIPIVSYLRLRGRCAACGTPIPRRYLVSEVAFGLLFALIYAVLFLPGPGSAWYPVGNGWWHAQGAYAIPAFLVVLWAVGSLAAMTLCDARTYLIPVAIPTWASAIAIVGWPIAAWIAGSQDMDRFPIPVPAWPACVAASMAMGGLAIGRVLLWTGVLPPSFSDYDDYVTGEDDVFADYPHARREMVKEAAFIGPAVLLGGIGWVIGTRTAAPESMHPAVAAFFAASAGFVAGGAIVWALRIVATLLLDTEALGLGDVHLMACAGAALGWRAAVIGFFVAPFVGMVAWAISLARSAPWRIPYGPSLAIGAAAAYFASPALERAVGTVLAVMQVAADRARDQPAGALGLAAVLAIGATAFARGARGGRGLPAMAAVVLMLGATIAWILSAAARPIGGIVVGVLLVIGCALGAQLARPGLEEGTGPRTAVARILKVLAFTVVAAGAFLLVSRPGGG
jgi:leader peptidase (prepilin peptidase)/N-methyltransferase